MYRLYLKNEWKFSLVWILFYVVIFSVADNISVSLGLEKVITAPVSTFLVLLLLGFLKKHKLLEQYGLCAFKGNLKNYLYFLPLVLMISVNLWNGVAVNGSAGEILLYIWSMLCVGFIEEVIFRGFLFCAISKDNLKLGIFLSSITFGMGHIVNLLNGADLFSTFLQVCYASAVGFLFTIIFYKGKSLWPCILTHGILNSLSIFAVQGSQTFHINTALVLCVLSIGYACWILRMKQADTQ